MAKMMHSLVVALILQLSCGCQESVSSTIPPGTTTPPPPTTMPWITTTPPPPTTTTTTNIPTTVPWTPQATTTTNPPTTPPPPTITNMCGSGSAPVTFDSSFQTSDDVPLSSYPESVIRQILAENNLDYDQIQASASAQMAANQSASGCGGSPVPAVPVANNGGNEQGQLNARCQALRDLTERWLDGLQCLPRQRLLLLKDNCWIVPIPFVECPLAPCCTVDWREGLCVPVQHVRVCVTMICITPQLTTIIQFEAILPVRCGCREVA